MLYLSYAIVVSTKIHHDDNCASQFFPYRARFARREILCSTESRVDCASWIIDSAVIDGWELADNAYL